ncbi:MAG: hypothetical protein WC370_07900 [Dehalococcoidales bacterium]
MAICPNCGRQTLRTKDWVCQWCGYPLISRAFRKIDKTYRELQDERLQAAGSADAETEPALEPEMASEPEPAPEPEPEPAPAPDPRPRPVTLERPVPQSVPVKEKAPVPTPLSPPAAPPAGPAVKSLPEPVDTPEQKPMVVPPSPPIILPAAGAPEPVAQPEIPPEAITQSQPEPLPETEINARPEALPEPEIMAVPEPPPPPPEALVRLDAIADGMEISADQLDALFRADKSGAHARLSGKTVVLKGTVDKVFIREHLEIRYIVLTGAGRKTNMGLRCTFNKEDSSQAGRLTEGESVMVRGRYDGYSKNIMFKDCQLL